MRTVTYRLVDLIRAVIPLGFRGENEYTRIIFDSKKAFEEYPTAVPSLAVTPPQGDSYPAVIVREGDLVYWDIVDSDVAYEGDGEGQLTFSLDGVVRKSYIFKTKISRSILPTGEAPSPIDDFITRAGAALTAIPQTIENALTEAKESGEFDGEDGVSPTLSVTDLQNGHRITITDASGTRSFDVIDGEDGQPGQPGRDGQDGQPGRDGQPGADGVSPTVAVTNITGGHRLTITDATGTKTVDVMDGAKGDPGDPTMLIDDTTPAANKTFSSNKLNTMDEELKSAINATEENVEDHEERIAELENGGYQMSKEYVKAEVDAWLDGHPEATTTVQDGSITLPKMNGSLQDLVVIQAESDKGTYHSKAPTSITFYPDSHLNGVTAKYTTSKNFLADIIRKTGTSNGIKRTASGQVIELSGTGTGQFFIYDRPTEEILDAIKGKTFNIYIYIKKNTPWETSSYLQVNDGKRNNVRKNFTAGGTELIGWTAVEGVTFAEDATTFIIKFASLSGVTFSEDDCIWIGMYETTLIDTMETVQNDPYTISVSGIESVDTATHESTIKYAVPTKDYVDEHTPDIIGYWSDHVYALPEDFGAVGDGVADDTAAIMDCIAYAKTSGKAVRGFNKYKTTSTIEIDGRGLYVYLKEINYTGNDSAVCLSNLEIIFEFNAITSSGVGLEFGGSDPYARQCQVKGNSIRSASHCLMIDDLVLYCTVEVRYLSSTEGNCIHRNKAGEWGGLEFIYRSSSCNCPNGWVAYNVTSSRFYDFTVEGNCKYGLYNPMTCVCYYWRHREQIDAMYYRLNGDSSRNNGPLIKFDDLGDGLNTFKYLSKDPIDWFSIDLSAFAGYETILSGQGSIDLWQKLSTTGENCGFKVRAVAGNSREIVSNGAYIIGGHLVVEPKGRSRTVIDIATVDFTLFDSANETDIVQAFNMARYLGTDWVIDTPHSDIYLNAYFGAIGYNDITVTQANGNTATIHDKLGNILFDGTSEGDGKWRLQCIIDKESNGRYVGTIGTHYYWNYDGTNEFWEITKLE